MRVHRPAKIGLKEQRPEDTISGENDTHRSDRAASPQPLGFYGGLCRIRTCDQRIKSPLLYRLS